MNPNSQCERCGRPARHHETLIDSGSVREHHLCGIHARRRALEGIKDVLISQAETFPSDWFISEGTDSERRQEISEAASLTEIGQLMRLDEIRKRFPLPPPSDD